MAVKQCLVVNCYILVGQVQYWSNNVTNVKFTDIGRLPTLLYSYPSRSVRDVHERFFGQLLDISSTQNT